MDDLKKFLRTSAIIHAKVVPLYLKRSAFIPRKPEDFCDGGAFPEIHVVQYPLGLGKREEKQKLGSRILPVMVDSHGNVTFDSIVKQNENASKIVYTQHDDLVPKILTADNGDEIPEEDLLKEIEETGKKTKEEFDKIVNACFQSSDSVFIKYEPAQQSAAFNSGANQRIIRMVDTPVDPLEPPKFKHKKVPKASGSPPVTVMHSPPRPVTVKDQHDWKIPPCTSNWKNPKGYTIPLDKRLAADGRGLQEVQISDNFARLSEALYVSEQKAREGVAMRSKLQKEVLIEEKRRKEQGLRELAKKARLEMTGAEPLPPAPMSVDKNMIDGGEMRIDHEQVKGGLRDKEIPKETKEDREERLQRDKIRQEKKRDRKWKGRQDAAIGKKSKITRDGDRDISETIALGMASTGACRGGEVKYDQRLFNQDKGMDSGFPTDDQYNVYDKELFTPQSTLSSNYRPKKDTDIDMYGGVDEQLEKVLNTDRFKPDKGFPGAGMRADPREKQVDFELQQEEADPFGLDQFWTKTMGNGRPMTACAAPS